jgi:diguanylate cyclase (GGDEF)-like protein
MEQNLCNPEQMLVEYHYRYFKHFVVICDAELRVAWCNNEFLRVANLEMIPVGVPINEFLSTDGQLSLRDLDNNPDRNIVLGFSFKGNASAHSCILLKRQGQLMIVAQDTVQADLGTMADMGKINYEMATLTRELSEKKTALENAYAKISELISTDYLTGLASRKYIQESFVKAISYARRTATPLTIIMADLDFFKQVNDNYGHLMGDKVLVAVAKLIRRSMRNEDLAGRFGGEEFIMILVGTDQAGGKIFAERLRQKTEQMKVSGIPSKITMSLGVTAFLPDDTPDDAIRRADEAMYMAKRAGRNQVVVL